MIRVRDLDASLRFYTNLLGMKLLRKRDYPSGTNLTFGALWRGGKLAKTLGSRRYLLLDFIH